MAEPTVTIILTYTEIAEYIASRSKQISSEADRDEFVKEVAGFFKQAYDAGRSDGFAHGSDN